MNELLLTGYELLTALPAAGYLSLRLRRGRQPLSGGQAAAAVLFFVYLLGVFHVTGAGTLYEALIGRPPILNLLPFSQHIDPVGYALNIVLLLPFGVLAPLLWSKLRGPGRIVLGGLAFSLLIEVSQLATNRSADVDDLLMNTVGALLGYALLSLLHRRSGEEQPLAVSPVCFIGAVFLCRFLLFYEMGAARLLYGF